MLKRLITSELVKWKNSKYRKPLILKGVRQCGKTYILKEFGSQYYEDIAYFDFEKNPAIVEKFEQDLDPERIITELGIINKKIIRPKATLVIFDEIQFCSRALTSLKYFYEKMPQYHIACAGSLLGIALSKPSSFPVGKVDFLTLYPMSFYEFLLANNENMLVDYLGKINMDSTVSKIFADKLTTLLKIFYITGGMPEVIYRWIETGDIAEVDKVQEMILNSYELEFAKHAPPKDFPKISKIWNSIPGQLARENSKFIYGHAIPGARAKDLEDAMQWLISAGMAYKVCMVSKPGMPISSYCNSNYFKLYLSDIGLLRKMANLPADSILGNDLHFKEFKGACAENYVLCELINITNRVPFYWKSENIAEVDFIAQIDSKIVPVEVKAQQNLKSRSLSIYRQKFSPEVSVRVSMMNLKKDNDLLNIPLYLLWTIKNHI